ncbi:MAG TPA: phosphatase PAP2 family protein [Gemmatimonadaceae bacterium]
MRSHDTDATRHAATRRLAAIVALGALLATPGGIAAQPADTTGHSREPLFTAADAWVAGGFALGTVAMLPLDRRIAEELQDPTTQANGFLKDASTGFEVISQPGAYIIGGSLYAIGRIGGNDRMADLGLHGSEAVLVAEVATYLLKGLMGRARPYVSADTVPTSFRLGRGFGHHDYRSFPSGHTSTAFAAAAAVTSETSRWWPRSTKFIAPLMYGGATMVGLSRMYNNRHWASDVVLGAAVGTFAGLKVVRYHHSHPGNRLDDILLGVSAVPDGLGGWMLVGSRRF